MANNPIFPFYVNDFEGGTRHMTDAEVGCYLRLLMAQFNRGGQLPGDETILRRYCTSFEQSWPLVKEKFEKINGTKIQNKRLEIERVKREKFIVSRVKNRKGENKKNENHVSNTSKTSVDHLGKGKEKGNGYGNGNGNLDGVQGEDFFLIPKMCAVWYENFVTYTSDKQNDYEGMGKILQFICRQAKVSDVLDTDTQKKILDTLKFVADEVNKMPFWVNKPIKSIANNIQEFYNNIKNPANGKSNSKTGFTREGINQELGSRPYNKRSG